MAAAQDAIGHLDIDVDQPAPVIAARRQRCLHRRIAKLGECGLVDLHIGAAGGGESGKLVVIGVDRVAPEFIDVAVGMRSDGFVAAAKMQRAGPGNGDLGHRGGQRLEQLEIIDVDRMRPAQLAPDDGTGLRHPAAGPIADVAHHRVRSHVAELGVEIAVVGAPPEFAVGCELEPETRLQGDGFLDRTVLGPCKLLLINLAAVEFLTQRQQSRRTQQAADMLGAEGGMYAHAPDLAAALNNHNPVGYMRRAEPLCCVPSRSRHGRSPRGPLCGEMLC